ncbi:type IV toxin-antitoxin system AbiEi family antitoxin [Hymenobacter sp. H14-R3]|uniref:type IV toxin-antitoxin system AbiEi family antitoxin n=1 Tax=Hymenobacter sp. H14-R3 TaxID=3046308 RepID=UPI0024B9BC2B|nr:type IV toxin-antitoxin system AbiEi family antitoxin [Hymenobacter sp. H14-R3]MDJ0364176.1 type IV toxin-antitoxin system AbiEi family antitoxin [Hymenobacter sp. H14-R3]
MPQAAVAAGAQLWQIGSALCLLATRPAAATEPPAPDPASAKYPTLLVYDYVSSKLGAQLRAQGQYYADAVGNAWLRHPGLLVSVQGCAPPRAPRPAVISPALQVQQLRLLFQLVLEPALSTYAVPKLAAHAQLPVLLVRRVLRSLAEQGFWQENTNLAGSKLCLPVPAHYWLARYAKTLRSRLNAHRYSPRNPATLARWYQQALPAECLWSGEAAAHLLLQTSAVPSSLTLYSQSPRSQLIKQLDLVPNTQGQLEILNAFAPAACFAPTDPRCVPPLLVYADLLASQKPFCDALAHQLWERYLTTTLPAAFSNNTT